MLDNSTMFIPFSFDSVKKKEKAEVQILCSNCKNEIKKESTLLKHKKSKRDLFLDDTSHEPASDKPVPVEDAREVFLKNGPTITDHCLLQSFSRVYGVPIDELRQELLQKVTPHVMDAKVFRGKVTVEGITYVVENGRLVTCYEKSKNKPNPKGKALKKIKEKNRK